MTDTTERGDAPERDGPEPAPTGGAESELSTALRDLLGALERLEIGLPVAGAAQLVDEQAEAIHAIRDHLLPRLEDRDAPLVAALFGAGGSGKSVVLNSLAQQRIGTPGQVRPSTRRAVIWAHTEHASRYWREFLRQVRERVGPSVETILGDDPLIHNLTLIDTPPIDYESEDGRIIARDVLGIADLCVFVASALRYADSAAWGFMKLAQRRGLPILFVVNRLPPDGPQQSELLDDYARRLAEGGLLLEADPSLLLPIAEQPLDLVHGGLPPAAVAALRAELDQLIDRELRRQVSRQATQGAALDLADRVRPLADAAEAQAAAAERLRTAVDAAYRRAVRRFELDLESGVYAPATEGDTAAAIGRLVTHAAGVAAQEAAASWEEDPVGHAILEAGSGALWRHDPHTQTRAEKGMTAWSARLEERIGAAVTGWRARRRRERAGAHLRRCALDIRVDPAAQTLRGLDPAKAAELAKTARRAFRELFEHTLTADVDRFHRIAGDPEPLRRVGPEIRSRVEQVVAAAKAMTE